MRARVLLSLWLVSATVEPPEKREPVRITSNPGGEWEPQWSPDGRRLSYGYGDQGDQNVVVLDVSTKAQTPLTPELE